MDVNDVHTKWDVNDMLNGFFVMQVSIASIKVAKFGHVKMISASFFFDEIKICDQKAFFLVMKFKGFSRLKISRLKF